MKMDRKKLEKSFEAYVAGYDLNDVKIYLKYVHTGKVAENCEAIARSLGVSEADVDLAWEIGMLHDIGRFEQVKRYGTYIDAKSIDHAQFGADLLFKEDQMEQFDADVSRYDLIELAIRCHNRYRLPEDLSERELLFCQIIRDADKVDIFRANYETGLEAIYNVSTEELKQSDISEEVFQAFREERAVLRTAKMCALDHLVGHLCLAFELVYPKSRELAAEQGYLKKLLDFQSENETTKEQFKEIQEKVYCYLKRRIQ